MVSRGEIVAALSLAIDLGRGQPMEHEVRTCSLAMRLGRGIGLGEAELADVYFVALLQWLGCTSHAHELAGWFDDEIAAHARAALIDFGAPREVLLDLLKHAGKGRSLAGRARALGSALAAGPGAIDQMFVGSCEVAEGLAERLGLPAAVKRGLACAFERWDGKGPRRVRGHAIPRAARLARLAHDAVVYHRLGGVDAARAVARTRAGSLYDPDLAKALVSGAGELLDLPDGGSSWDAVLGACPPAREPLDDDALDAALAVVADFVDLKSPWTVGHSRGVAELAARAAEARGLGAPEVRDLRRAGWLHDLGKVGVPNGIWDKPGPLRDAEWERVRMHAYFTERVLARPAALARLGAIASADHERLDGSGYPRGPAPAAAARLLAAADVYHALGEARPYRPAHSPDQAASLLRDEARRGRLEGAAVEAVLAAAGHAPKVRGRTGPNGLSVREVEVLGLLARGLTNRAIAKRLFVSERTAQHHVQHIYDKIGVSTRAAATLYALEHDLVAPEK